MFIISSRVMINYIEQGKIESKIKLVYEIYRCDMTCIHLVLLFLKKKKFLNYCYPEIVWIKRYGHCLVGVNIFDLTFTFTISGKLLCAQENTFSLSLKYKVSKNAGIICVVENWTFFLPFSSCLQGKGECSYEVDDLATAFTKVSFLAYVVRISYISY